MSITTVDSIETELADLREVSIGELLRWPLQDDLTLFRGNLISQVERPRVNVGTGPPGHAD